MCKFNAHLLIFLLALNLAIVQQAQCASLGNLLNLNDEPNEDVTYDQRQNGTENFRIRIDGVAIVVADMGSNSNSPMNGALGELSESDLINLYLNSGLFKKNNNEIDLQSRNAASLEKTTKKPKIATVGIQETLEIEEDKKEEDAPSKSIAMKYLEPILKKVHEALKKRLQH